MAMPRPNRGRRLAAIPALDVLPSGEVERPSSVRIARNCMCDRIVIPVTASTITYDPISDFGSFGSSASPTPTGGEYDSPREAQISASVVGLGLVNTLLGVRRLECTKQRCGELGQIAAGAWGYVAKTLHAREAFIVDSFRNVTPVTSRGRVPWASRSRPRGRDAVLASRHDSGTVARDSACTALRQVRVYDQPMPTLTSMLFRAARASATGRAIRKGPRRSRSVRSDADRRAWGRSGIPRWPR